MNDVNTQKLFSEFPTLYRGKDLPMTQNLMCFGFEIEDGWFEIIYQLSKDINAILVKNNVSQEDYPITFQCKEKFGGLRYYIESVPDVISDEIFAFIEKAEKLSYETCEFCGKTGKPCGKGWIKTLCSQCETKK